MAIPATTDPKKTSRLKGALKTAFSKKAPWWVKAIRCAVLVVSIYPSLEFGLMPHLPGRPLTPGETTELSEIFKNSVDYSKERVHSSKALDFIVNPMAHFTDNLVYGHTRGDVVITHTEVSEPDYSKKYVNEFSKEVFFHENVHIWQYQNRPWEMTAATAREIFTRLSGGPEALYTYKLEPGKDLLQYTIEQQAVIVTDYYMRLMKGDQPENCMNAESGDKLKALYESTLKNFKANPSYIKNAPYKLR